MGLWRKGTEIRMLREKQAPLRLLVMGQEALLVLESWKSPGSKVPSFQMHWEELYMAPSSYPQLPKGSWTQYSSPWAGTQTCWALLLP